ncbi:MAG: DUF2062 domain-containing protein [Burkholderiaceae bacterium]
MRILDLPSALCTLQRWVEAQLLRVKQRVLGILAKHPRLQPVAHHVMAPHLWRIQHESVARAVAIGFFLAFVLPVGRSITAALCSIGLRANIPVSALATFITNPFNIGFWLWLAYELGSWLLGSRQALTRNDAALDAHGIVVWMHQVGWPAVLGMAIFAVFFALLGYATVHLLWRLRVVIKRHNRHRCSLKRSNA